MAVAEPGHVGEGVGLGTNLRFAGPPTSTTYVGAPKGAVCIDTTNGILYQNQGTATAPSWVKVGLET